MEHRVHHLQLLLTSSQICLQYTLKSWFLPLSHDHGGHLSRKLYTAGTQYKPQEPHRCKSSTAASNGSRRSALLQMPKAAETLITCETRSPHD